MKHTAKFTVTFTLDLDSSMYEDGACVDRMIQIEMDAISSMISDCLDPVFPIDGLQVSGEIEDPEVVL